MGCKTLYNPVIADEILDWMWEGKSLLAYCRRHGAPGRRTIYDWCDDHPEFARPFKVASKARGPLLMEMAQEIADDDSKDVIELDGKQVLNHARVARDKVRVDQLNRRAACYNPAECGTKTLVGGDGGEPIRIVDRDTAAKELASILAVAAARQDAEPGEP